MKAAKQGMSFKKRMKINKMKCFYSILSIIIIVFIFPFQGICFGQDNRSVIRNTSSLNHKSGKIGVYRALIIGIQNYEDPEINDLKTPLNDAKAMADVLENRYGFKINRKTDLLLDKKATKEAIYTALRKITHTAEPEDSVLIYYAGHGDIDRTLNDGWWIPVDAKGGNPVTYLDNTLVQKVMKSMKSKHVLLISDSCYSGTLFGRARAMPTVIDDKYYLNLYNEKSRWGMTSGNKTPVSDSGSAGHSVFAYQLIKKLEKNTKPYISTREIYTDIAPIITNNSDQSPLCNPIKGTGDMGGEFIFVAQGTTTITTPDVIGGSKGKLSIISDPEGADIFVDNRFKGISPLDLDPGTYNFMARLKDYV
ncbi:caspase family protein [Desulfobacula toluolica]|uniref:Putative peptidase C14, caspase n=1 Tax=Desulfobacula toluolica (strain DSM 7467 / Tol2) TaxID=651182 RepID=K0NHC7_DESTT|nr:caspase family protein [Desulfobacula toluolica]CCK80676.1 putative peptidase C14, caspase [Desulfobacula toluolica Tol2]